MKHRVVAIARVAASFILFAAAAGFGAEPPGALEIPSRIPAGNSPLHLAALRGDAGAVEALLSSGADPNVRNQFGATPLHYGVGNERIVAALLARGAEPNAISETGSTPLFSAVARADGFDVVRRLIDAGADLNYRRPGPDLPPRRGEFLLAAAIHGRDRRTIALLLEPGRKLDPKQLAPALVTAAEIGDFESTRVLVDRGANLNTTFSLTGTAVNAALLGAHDDIARLLIERGADLTAKSARGNGTTSLLFSAYRDNGDATMAKLLVERGVDIHSSDEIGETALSFGAKNGVNTELVRFLTAYGAKSSTTESSKAVPAREVPVNPEARVAMIRDSSQRAIDLLQRSSTAFLQSEFVRNQGKCISCHQQSLPAVAYGLARERGLHVDEHEIGRQLVAQSIQRSSQMSYALELLPPTGGPTFTLGHDAEEFRALNWAADATTEAMSHYLLGVQAEDGSWGMDLRRAPMEDGRVGATAWSLRAVQLYPPAGRRAEAENAVHRAREWLTRQKPPSFNERVFQLLGLAWANESTGRLQPLVDALIQEQQPDGGWKQLPGRTTDAWATGTVLSALHKAGMSATNAVYQRGVDFLLRTQFPDGSWWVRSRTWPFQPHFDSGFPHGRDQWISSGATAWATSALLLALEPTVPIKGLRDGRQLMAAFIESAVTVSAEPAASVLRAPTKPIAAESRPDTRVTVDFVREIKPILERSCVDCHGGSRPKAGLSMTTREALLKGGQNGEPAIVPGHAVDSHLLRYVADQVEDLEMPPLNRRDKYPALTSEEITRLRTWIDGGAEWSESP